MRLRALLLCARARLFGSPGVRSLPCPGFACRGRRAGPTLLSLRPRADLLAQIVGKLADDVVGQVVAPPRAPAVLCDGARQGEVCGDVYPRLLAFRPDSECTCGVRTAPPSPNPHPPTHTGGQKGVAA